MENQLDIINKQIESKNAELVELAKLGRPSKENPTGEMPEIYYKAKNEQYILINKRNIIIDQLTKNNESNNESRTFINSYGEATKRDIHCSVYNRLLKRQERAVRRNLGL